MSIKKFWPSKIRNQLVLGITLVNFLIMSIFVFDLVKRQRAYLEQQTIQQAKSLAETFAVNASSGILTNDFQGLEEIVESHKDFPNLKYAMILSEDGLVLAHTDTRYIGMKLVDRTSLSLKQLPVMQTLVDDGSVLDIAIPILNRKKEIIGWARIGQGEEQISKESIALVYKGVIYLIIAIILGLILAILIGRYLTSSLNKLLDITQKIKEGNRGLRATASNSFEITQLGKSINQMMDEIDANERLLASVLESLPVGVMILNKYGRIVKINNEISKIWTGNDSHYVDIDTIGDFKGWFLKSGKLIEPEEWPGIRAIRKGETLLNEEIEIECRDKSHKIVLNSALPLRDSNGKIVSGIVISLDITDRKKSEKKLEESVSLLSATLQSTADGILVTNGQGLITSFNKRFADLWQIPIHLLVSGDDKKTIDFVMNQLKYPQNFVSKIQEIYSKAENVSFDILEFKDGRIYERFSQPQMINEQCVGRVWSFRDVTERRKAEDALKESEERFRSFAEHANDLIYLLTGEGNLVYVSPNAKEILGHEINEFAGKPVLGLLVHPDDVPHCRRALEETISTGKKQVNIEYRILHKNGEWKWFSENATAIYNAESKSNFYFGIARDITKEKQLRELLLKQNEFFEQSFSQSSISTQILDKEGWCERINPKLSELFGVLPENIEGKVYNIFNDAEIIKHGIVPYLEKVFKQGTSAEWDVLFDIGNAADSQDIEVAVKNKKWFHNWAYPIFDNNGELTNVIIQHTDISENKKFEEALKESEDKFSKAFHLSPNVILISRISDGLIVDLNEKAIEFSGYSRSESIGMSTLQWNGWSELNERTSEREKFIKQLTEKGRVTNFENQFMNKSGEIRYCTFSGEIIELKGVKYIMTVIHDITESKKAAEEIQERVTQLQMLGDNLPKTVVYQLVLDQDGSTKFIYLSQVIEKITSKKSADIMQDSSVFYDMIFEEDLQKLLEERRKSLLTMEAFNVEVRIKTDSGEMKWINLHSVPRKLSDGKILFDGVQIDITSQKISEEKIKESEQLLNQTGELARVGGWTLNLATQDLVWTKEIFKLTDVEPDYKPEVSKALDYYHPDDREMLSNLIERATLYGESFNTELRFITAKERSGWVKMIVLPIMSEGKVVKLSGVVQDITERKLAEKILLESETKYRTLIEQASDAIVIYSLDGKIHDFNRSAYISSGYTKEEFEKLSYTDFLGDDKNLYIDDVAIEKMLSGENYLFVRKLRKKDGTFLIAEFNTRMLSDNRILAFIRDITERIEAEQKIKESEDKFSKAFHISPDVILISSISDGTIIDVNSRILDLLKFSREEVMGKSLLKLKVWKDESIRDQFISILKENGSVANFETPFLTRDGEIRHVLVSAEFIELKGEKFLLSNVRDITERKNAQDALFKSLQETSDYKYALDQSSIVSITDEDGIIKYVNSNFCELYDFTVDEVIGKNHNEIVKSGYHPDSFWKNFWETIQSGKVLQAEVCNKSRDGSIFWQDTTVVPFLDENGKPYQYLAIRTDITEKRKLEMKLAEDTLNYQRLITEVTIQVQEKEKKYLGFELHDNINQILATVKMYLGIIKSKQDIPDELVDRCHSYINTAIKEIRKLSHSLVAPSLGEIGLIEALKELVVAETKASGIKMKLVNEINSELKMDDNKRLMLYRIVQEQMSNIMKYSKAKKAVILLALHEGNLHLSISDDGVGFDTSAKVNGIGLKSIHNRVEFYSGRLEIISSPGKGCKLNVSIPV